MSRALGDLGEHPAPVVSEGELEAPDPDSSESGFLSLKIFYAENQGLIPCIREKLTIQIAPKI
ncbi:MAG: hypothetical protein RIQ79_814 [Verrucomicrobiota bacterium]|jgi:hypothetical protein